MDNDIVLIDKPAGWTSFDVVAKIRSKIRTQYREKGEKPTKRQLKVGHAGTLDPFATGLLVILLGDGTKKAGKFLKLDKVYEATIRLGETSTTGDPEGEITTANNRQPTHDEVERLVQTFVGQVTQIPPQFSAIKISGVRAYKLAHQGKEVAVPPRIVTIHSIDVLDYTYPYLTIRTHVGSGTYIRTLAEDIGTALGTGAYCQALRRTKIANWHIDDALTLEEYLAL